MNKLELMKISQGSIVSDLKATIDSQTKLDSDKLPIFLENLISLKGYLKELEDTKSSINAKFKEFQKPLNEEIDKLEALETKAKHFLIETQEMTTSYDKKVVYKSGKTEEVVKVEEETMPLTDKLIAYITKAIPEALKGYELAKIVLHKKNIVSKITKPTITIATTQLKGNPFFDGKKEHRNQQALEQDISQDELDRMMTGE